MKRYRIIFNEPQRFIGERLYGEQDEKIFDAADDEAARGWVKDFVAQNSREIETSDGKRRWNIEVVQLEELRRIIDLPDLPLNGKPVPAETV